ncbi:hypothetical protein ACFY7H_31430 [Streptomyces sp. NPDC012794]
MSAAHTAGIRGNARQAAPASPSCTAAGSGRPSFHSDDNGWD